VKTWIMIDIETSGPLYGRHSMTELGAAAGTREQGLIDRLELVVAPISDEVKTSRDSFDRAKREGSGPRNARRGPEGRIACSRAVPRR
jgi:hypothetical protein